jgi:predicted DNA-binding transcriptional regulator AlpA
MAQYSKDDRIGDVLLTRTHVRARVGNVSTMCIWRWTRNDRVLFPEPDLTINGRSYWYQSSIVAWEKRMAETQGATMKPRRRMAEAA